MNHRSLLKFTLPIAGVAVASLLFVVATALYPGGTRTSINSVGYDWAQNYVSTLFEPVALNGAVNPARHIAIPAMLSGCISVVAMFGHLAIQRTARPMQKLIALGGTGSMVCAFLAVTTPLHDLMLGIGLLMFFGAALATLKLQRLLRQTRLFFFGMASIAMLAASGVMYYGNLLLEYLAVLQKIAIFSSTLWLVLTHAATFNAKSNGRAI